MAALGAPTSRYVAVLGPFKMELNYWSAADISNNADDTFDSSLTTPRMALASVSRSAGPTVANDVLSAITATNSKTITVRSAANPAAGALTVLVIGF